MSEFLPIWSRMSAIGSVGRWAFSRAVGFRAPYFATIRPAVLELEPGRCVVAVPKRRRVLNHLGTVHAIASCNAAELAAGMAIDAALPASYRWIPQGMTVEYRKKARTSLRATAQVPSVDFTATDRVDVDVALTDSEGVVVVHATITMAVGPKHV